ncbi:progesterone receptor [Hypomesus transpacificus]|uniref:progesterone receptor n=1 Tax=Hypomesus transpacificus TaxID=137520 RepID=UPI001F08250E|nr:progesterone receptor [Hypomesus transpacificus]
MESKASGKLESSSIADSADTSEIVRNLPEKYREIVFGQEKFSNEPQPQASTSSAMRNFGHIGAFYPYPGASNNSAMYEDCISTDYSLGNKSYYGRVDEYLKTNSVPMEDVFAKVYRAKEDTSTTTNAPESLQGMPSISATGVCKFIKDEEEPSLIMDTQCHDFDVTADLNILDASYTERKQQIGFVEPTHFPTSATGEDVLDDASLLADLNQTQQFAMVPQIRSDTRGTLSGKGMMHFDTTSSSQATQHLMIHKGEIPRWSIQSTEFQLWCQSAGVAEEKHPCGYVYPDGIHGSTLLQRSPTTCNAYSGLPPQRLCMICGDEASGCHYGVLTCGSCKVFFKRAVEGHHNYLCAGRNDCIVDKIRRKNCPACRLRKCYQAGMMLGGRKLKRFGGLKALGMAPSLMFQSPMALPGDSQALASMPCISSLRELQLSPQIVNILENIEPEVVCSGFDNSQPDMPHLLLNSLNRLCERQLLWIVRWSKSLPGFRTLHINDQMTLIQYSWMNLMVFSLGWRSFQNVTSEYLYFAPDLILSQERMRRSPIYDLCLAMQFIPQEFASLQVTREEFLCMKALMLLNTVPLEGLKSQAQFEEMRQNYIRELTKAIHIKEKGVVASSQRFYHLTKLMDSMHEIVKKVNLYCLSTFIQADAMKVEFPEMMTEVIASQLPKVLAGMVKPLLFHNK